MTDGSSLSAQHRQLQSPSAASDQWWPVRICTLGGFEVHVEGLALRTEGKAQTKPLGLLRTLVLHGGRYVQIEDLISALWNTPGRNARGTFDVTVLRLRKLLGRAEALLVRSGELALNPQCCWLDLWHFERNSFPQRVEVDAIAVSALKSYRGPFLPLDADKPGAVAVRERLRAHFHAAVLHVGRHFERTEDWKQALQTYHHATQADPLAEDYYCREMLCQIELGLLNEARLTYDRCRLRIREAFNTKPSIRLDRLLECVNDIQLIGNSRGRSREGRDAEGDADTAAVCCALSVGAMAHAEPERPVSIRTLGEFHLAIQGSAPGILSGGQRRPLDVLRAIVALGGRGVPITLLVDSLWNADRTVPRGAFDSALLRLRKFLARDDAVQVHDGMVTLNPEVCWVDAWSFEQAAIRFLETHFRPDAERALALYGGVFLGGKVRRPWAAVMRERLSLKFRQIITTLGDHYERARDWDGAASTYQRGMTVDGSVEEFYRRLISCYWRMGRQTDAVRIYRRCCDALQVLSQRSPSAVTTAIYRRVLDSSMSGWGAPESLLNCDGVPAELP